MAHLFESLPVLSLIYLSRAGYAAAKPENTTGNVIQGSEGRHHGNRNKRKVGWEERREGPGDGRARKARRVEFSVDERDEPSPPTEGEEEVASGGSVGKV